MKNETIYGKAIREAVEETIKALGMDSVKALSWFPRNRKV